MGERKVVNKYFPPDFNPAKIPRKTNGKNKQINVRTMLSMNIRCNLCGNYMSRGTKFNVRKEEVIGKKYLGEIRVFRFYFKCPVCCAEITILTDPKNGDYVVESGAKRNFEPWRAEDGEAKEFEDSMKSLENRTRDSKREMDKLAALHELKSINSRHSKISVDSLLNKLQPKGEEDKLSAEDEAIIKSRFRGGSREFVRRINDEYDWDESPVGQRNNNLKKRKVVSGEFTSNPTDLLLLSEGSSSIHGSSKSQGTYGTFVSNFMIVKKKSQNKQEGAQKTTNMKDNRQRKSNNTLQCLFQDYGNDEENSPTTDTQN